MASAQCIATQQAPSSHFCHTGWNQNKLTVDNHKNEKDRDDEKSRFTEAQIMYALQQVESGMPAAGVCGQPGCSEASLYILEEALRQSRYDRSEGASSVAR
jgi:hypothetical protein